MNKKINKKNKGFSLVELIIVIAIMAILAGVLVPQFVRYLRNSRISADIDQAQQIYSAVAAEYAADATRTTAVITTGSPQEITNAVAGNLNMGTVAPTSKVNPGEVFFYEVSSTGDVKVSIGASGAGASAVQILPNVASGSAWDN